MLDSARYGALGRKDRAPALASDLRALADAIDAGRYILGEVDTSCSLDTARGFPTFRLNLSCFIRPDKD